MAGQAPRRATGPNSAASTAASTTSAATAPSSTRTGSTTPGSTRSSSTTPGSTRSSSAGSHTSRPGTTASTLDEGLRQSRTSGVFSLADAAFVPHEDAPVFVISVAAELAGMHAQTLRQYDRLGIVSPQRTRGGGRRYSHGDVAKLLEVQRLSQEEGVSLAGIRRIMVMRDEIEALRRKVSDLGVELERLRRAAGASPRVFAAGRHGDVVAGRPGERPVRENSRAVVVWQPDRRR